MKVTCERCMYWDNSHEEERAQGRSGFCRQSPPHPEWHWALTDPHDWCGQAMPNVHQGTGTWTGTITTKTVVVAEVGGTGGGDAPSPPPQRQRFAPPTAQQVMDYADGLGYDGFDAEAFCDHYASVGWTVGRSPMKDWHAAVRQWRRREPPPF